MDWAQHGKNNNYLALKGMIAKRERLADIADQRADRQKNAILAAIDAGEFTRKKHLYQPFGLSMKTLYRAFSRWGMDLKETRQRLDDIVLSNRNKSMRFRPEEQDLINAIPVIMRNLGSANPEAFTAIVKKLGTSTLRMHKLMQDRGIDSKKLVKMARLRRLKHTPLIEDIAKPKPFIRFS